jgi:hypothetical protein
MLLHAKARWPSCVHLCLWPYALRNAVRTFGTLHRCCQMVLQGSKGTDVMGSA